MAATAMTPERRFHAVNNALQVITGAASALDLYRADLTTRDAAQLEDAITAALAELATLLDLGGRVERPAGSRSLAVAAREAARRGSGVRLETDDVPALRDDGDELAGLLAEVFASTCSPCGGVIRASEAGNDVVIEIGAEGRDGGVRWYVLRLAAG